MFKFSALSAAFIMTAISANSAHAADNTIRFIGEVSGQTCDVSVNDSTTSSPVVLLQPAKISELATSGSVSTPTKFKISVKNCIASSDKSIGIAFASNNADASGNLANSATGDTAAKYVSIKLLDPQGKAIDMSSGYARTAAFTVANGATSGEAEYTAEYVSTGVATAGAVEANVQYAITYL